jgi:hypothetical protein
MMAELPLQLAMQGGHSDVIEVVMEHVAKEGAM